MIPAPPAPPLTLAMSLAASGQFLQSEPLARAAGMTKSMKLCCVACACASFVHKQGRFLRPAVWPA